MRITLQEITDLVDGSLSGDPTAIMTGAGTLRDAHEGDITFAEAAKFADQLITSPATAVIVAGDFQPDGMAYITVENVKRAFDTIFAHFHPPRKKRSLGVSPRAEISPTATIGENVEIHAGAVIGDDVEIGEGSVIYPGVQIMAGCKLGAGTTLYPNVVLYEDVEIGEKVLIHAGAVLGAFGFGYETTGGQHTLSAQFGNVKIENNVEIGAGTTIDRGSYGSTVIGEGTKIDNQVQIAHNCRIGRHNIICSQVGIAGSTTTGDYVVMAGQVGLRDHVHIGDRTVLGAKSGVMNDIPDDSVYVGIPATPEREQMLQIAAVAKLPDMRKQMKRLQKTVKGLSDAQDDSSHQGAA